MGDRGTSGEFTGFRLTSVSFAFVHRWTKVFSGKKRVLYATFTQLPATIAIGEVFGHVRQYPWYIYTTATKEYQ